MPNSIHIDPRGPDWPLGFIGVVTPGTPVGIMSVVDPNGVNDPSVPVPPATGSVPALTQLYSPRAQQIIFMAYKTPAGSGPVLNTGNIFICRKAVGSGSGNRNDTGVILMILTPGQVWVLAGAAGNFDTFSPYRYFIDANNAGDGAIVVLLPQG